MTPAHAVRLDGTQFWIIHRRKPYGPFDYEWSQDFCGMTMLYNGSKFGEYCSREELFADLSPYHLPDSVAQVSAIVMGCVLYGVMHGLTPIERTEMLRQQLATEGFVRFVLTAQE